MPEAIMTPETAARAVVIPNFELGPGDGTADYLLHIDRKAARMLKVNMQSATLASPTFKGEGVIADFAWVDRMALPGASGATCRAQLIYSIPAA